MFQDMAAYQSKLKVRLLRPDGALIGDYRDIDHAVEMLGCEFIGDLNFIVTSAPDGPETSEAAR